MKEKTSKDKDTDINDSEDKEKKGRSDAVEDTMHPQDSTKVNQVPLNKECKSEAKNKVKSSCVSFKEQDTASYVHKKQRLGCPICDKAEYGIMVVIYKIFFVHRIEWFSYISLILDWMHKLTTIISYVMRKK